MAWRLPGDKPLSEPRMVQLLMHICDPYVRVRLLSYNVINLWCWFSVTMGFSSTYLSNLHETDPTQHGISRNRPARPGLLYLSIAGGQCHTRPLMNVPGFLGCCTPVAVAMRSCSSLTKTRKYGMPIPCNDCCYVKKDSVDFH